MEDCWKYFDKSEVQYEPVSRHGWPDVGMNGGGDPDWVDYRVVEKE